MRSEYRVWKKGGGLRSTRGLEDARRFPPLARGAKATWRAVTLTASTGGNRVGKSEYLNYVNGAWVPSHTEATYTVINPATGGRVAAGAPAGGRRTRAADHAARGPPAQGERARPKPGGCAPGLAQRAEL